MKKYLIFAIIFLNLVFFPINSISAQSQTPDWLRNVALWYEQDIISDNEFINALKFLLKTNVVSISDLENNNWPLKNEKQHQVSVLLDSCTFSSKNDINFAAVGDVSVKRDGIKTLASINSVDPELILFAGDLSYTTPQDWFDASDFLGKERIHIALGNHDVENGNDQGVYLKHYDMAREFYSFDYLNAHFVALATDTTFWPDSIQYKFLVDDLRSAKNNPNIDWIIVFLHYPLYTSINFTDGPFHISYNTKEFLSPIFYQFDVDIVIQAHIHYYERLKPLGAYDTVTSNNINSYIDPDGPIYVTVGTGGVASKHNPAEILPSEYVTAHNEYGFLNLNLADNGNVILGEFIANTGDILDSFQVCSTDNDVTKTNLSNVDLSQKNLSGVNLAYSDLSDIDLSDKNLSNSDLLGVDLSDKDLTNTVLIGTKLTHVDLSNVDLSNKDLTDTVLRGAVLSNADLTNVNLVGKDLTRTNLSNVDLSNKDLTDTVLGGAILSNADLTNVTLAGKDLTRTNLSNVDLSNKDLTDTVLRGAVLSNADLTNVNLTGKDLNDINLSNVDLTRTNLQDVKLYYANFSGANLSNRNFSGMDLSFFDLSHAILNNVILRDTTFFRANLAYTDLSGKDLSHSNFSRSNVDGANFEGVTMTGTALIDVDFTKIKDKSLVGANLTLAAITYSNFEGVDLSNTDFTRANLSNSTFMGQDFTDAILFGTVFERAQLSNSNFEGVDLSHKGKIFRSYFEDKAYLAELSTSDVLIELDPFFRNKIPIDFFVEGNDFVVVFVYHVSFFDANLQNTNFANANLQAINFGNANLREAIFVQADLTNSNLGGADLTGADLRNAIVKGTGFEGAILDCLNHPICN